ncbi:MAG: hypothetical protein ACI82Z_001787 [Cellvibrionaceae bacterium]|jgi:hypothetical protein
MEIKVIDDSTSYVFDRYHGGKGINGIQGKNASDVSVLPCSINPTLLKMRPTSAVLVC